MPKMLAHRSTWNRPTDNAPMKLEVWRIKGGIIQKIYLNENVIQETFSPRPYKLGQACDGTIDTCVMALYIHLCLYSGIDPAELYREAYPDALPLDSKQQKRILRTAVMEGIERPKTWQEHQVEGLLKSLTEINCHALVNVLDRMNADIQDVNDVFHCW